MSYQLKTISPEQNDSFVNGHKKEHFMQLSLWGKVKSTGDWKDELLGLFKADELVGTVMLLHRKIPFIGGYLYYAPRGFVVDFNPESEDSVWALPSSLAATGGIEFSFSSSGYLDVSVPRVAFS